MGTPCPGQGPAFVDKDTEKVVDVRAGAYDLPPVFQCLKAIAVS